MCSVYNILHLRVLENFYFRAIQEICLGVRKYKSKGIGISNKVKGMIF